MKADPDVIAVLFALTVACAGCASTPFTLNKEPKPQTRAEWIEAENAKNEPCKPTLTSGWMAAGGDGYSYYEEYCREGRIVYVDTTEQNQRWQAEQQAKQSDLISAARSRILTPKEMKLLLDYGPGIFTRPMTPYNQQEIEKQFDELLYQQARLKTLEKP